MTGSVVFLVYAGLFLASYFLVSYLSSIMQRGQDFTSLKTVTFGDESAVTPNRAASVISILTIFLLWGMFTGSSLLPRFLHAPGPFQGSSTARIAIAISPSAQTLRLQSAMNQSQRRNISDSLRWGPSCRGGCPRRRNGGSCKNHSEKVQENRFGKMQIL